MMNIGFCIGVFYKINKSKFERFDNKFLENFKILGSNCIELMMLDMECIDYLLNNHINLEGFDYISIHTPDLSYQDNDISHRTLSKIGKICKKINIHNVVFHTDKVLDRDVINQYKRQIPISIENMDNQKESHKSVAEIKAILDKYDFGLTLDLQHCLVNDPTMKLAEDFHKELGDKIVEYHISGAKDNYHYKLFETNEDKVIKSLKLKDKPIIIESVCDQLGDQIEELKYITDRL